MYHLFRITAIIVALLFFGVGVLLFFTYIIPSNTPLVKSFGRILPAITVDGKVISAGDVAENTDATRSFYENQDFANSGVRIDFSTPDGKKRLKVIEREIINNLIEGALIEDLAKENGITVSQEDIAQALSETLQTGGEVAVASERVALYGWDLPTFSQKVIKPSLYVERLQEHFMSGNVLPAGPVKKIEAAKQMIVDGRTFEEAAQKYSESAGAQAGGSVGYMRRDQLDEEIADAVFSLEVGEVSDVFDSRFGVHLFEVEQFQNDVDGEEMASLRHIFVPKKTFSEYLNESFQGKNIRIFLPGYAWSSEVNLAFFFDQEMILFEQKMQAELEVELRQEALNSASESADVELEQVEGLSDNEQQ